MSENQSMGSAADEKRRKLGELIDQKRGKKSVTRSEAKQFTDAWVALTNTVGVNDDTVALLYRGFQFAAGEPLYRYVSESKSKTAYISFLSSKPTSANDQGIALKVAINLFAMELIRPTSAESVGIIARSIPRLSVNKDGNPFGTLCYSIRRILIKPLVSQRIQPDIHLPHKDASAILSVLRVPVESFAKNPKTLSVEASAACCLLAWLENQASKGDGNDSSTNTHQPLQSLSPKSPATTPSGSLQTSVNSGFASRPITENPVRVSKNVKTPVTKSTTLTSAVDQMIDKPVSSSKKGEEQVPGQSKDYGIPAVISFLTAYQSDFENLQARFDRAQAERRDALKRIDALEQRLRNAKQENAGLQERVTTLAGQCSDLQSELSSQRERYEATRGNLEAAEEMLATISRRDTRQADESTRRLARELKVEYADFMDAADQPMSPELGENMRDQLRNVFQIIMASGIEL